MDLFPDALNGFADALIAKGKLPATIDSYCRDARDFLEYLRANSLPVQAVEPETLIHYQEHLAANAHDKSNSIRRKVIGTRQFFRYLTESRHLNSTPFDDVPIPERLDHLPEPIDPKIITQYIDIQDYDSLSFKEVRDHTILSLLAFEGVKANELIHLTWQDYFHTDHHSSLRIPGLRSRTIVLSPLMTQLMEIYKTRFVSLFDKDKKSPDTSFKHIFISFKGRNGAVPLPQMTRHGLKFLLYELGERLNLKHLNSELLRHHAVEFLLRQGKSTEEIMYHLGLRRLGNIAKHAVISQRKQIP